MSAFRLDMYPTSVSFNLRDNVHCLLLKLKTVNWYAGENKTLFS